MPMLNGTELKDQLEFMEADRIVVKSNPHRGLPTYYFLTIPNECQVDIDGKSYLILEESGQVSNDVFDGLRKA